MHRMFSHLDIRMMLQFALLFCLSIHLINAFDTPSETLVDLYHKINSYGSLSKATSFIPSIQMKLKRINTVRVVLYAIKVNRSSLTIQTDKIYTGNVTLIELRCNLSNVFIRLGKSGRQRQYRLKKISQSIGAETSYDLTPFMKNGRYYRRIQLLFDRISIEQRVSIFFYSTSNRGLFSLPAMKRVKRTILPADPSAGTCAKQEYEIDFSQFSFGQWIVEPKTFNAYVCSGSCPNPLSSRYFPSNHAILLSLIRSQTTEGQQPSCVPVKLKPLCLLYYDRDELVIKYHRDMIVEECGCR